MAKVVRVMSLVAITTLASVAAAQAQTPLNATFRDATSGPTGGVTDDAVKSDGLPYNGYDTWQVKRTVYIDGAYINSNGGIDLNLEPGYGLTTPEGHDRALRIQLLGSPSTNVPAECRAPLQGGVDANDVDFRFNVTGGIESLGPGATARNGETIDAFGVINFRSSVDPNTSWALLVNTNSGGLTPGTLSITRNSEHEQSWTVNVSSDGVALLQCTRTVNRRLVRYDVGSYAVPFELNVTKPVPPPTVTQ